MKEISKNLLTILFILFSLNLLTAKTNQDSLKLNELKNRISFIEKKIETVENNQLNYRIEKDLLKETYSNNYEKLNMIITIILGIIGVLGYLGIRDINSVKKEYVTELGKLKALQTDFENKAKEFNDEKIKLDSDIKQILIENEEQNKKIKFIELREKIKSFLLENKLYEALDFIGIALEIVPEDETILKYKARTFCRLNKLGDSLNIHKTLHKTYPEKTGNALDLIECMFFAKDYENLEPLLEKHKIELEEKSEGKVLKILNLFKLYNTNKKNDILESIKSMIDFNDLDSTTKKVIDWDLTEAKFVAAHLEESEYKNQIQNIIWYLDGQINGKILCKRLKIDIPKKDENK